MTDRKDPFQELQEAQAKRRAQLREYYNQKIAEADEHLTTPSQEIAEDDWDATEGEAQEEEPETRAHPNPAEQDEQPEPEPEKEEEEKPTTRKAPAKKSAAAKAKAEPKDDSE